MSDFITKAYEQCIKPIDKLFRIASLYKPSMEVYPLKIEEFDRAMDGGTRDGELITISGPTGQGKTLMAQTLCSNFSKQGIPSLFFSYEMSPWYLKEKFVKMNENENLLVYSPVEMISGELDFIRQQIRIGVQEKACKIVFIDHLHYLIDLKSSFNSSLLIGGIVRELKKMAIQEKVIIFLIAHTKKIYQDEKLDLSSVRDSSLISQESDYVFLVERKKKEEKKILDPNSQTEWLNETRIALAKNRRTGKLFHLDFLYKIGKLIPITKDYV